MIHMGSDHRCVMATFLINMLGKDTHAKKKKEKHETIGYNEHKQTEKNINIEMPELEKRHQEIADTMKKAAARKGKEVHDTRNNAKEQVTRENAAAAEANRTLEEAEVQEIERRSMKRSSTVANHRGVPALIEHRRQDGWTSTLNIPEHNSEEHLGAQVPRQDEEAGSIVFHSSSNTSEIKNDNNEARVMASAAAKVSEDLSTKDAENLRLIEEWRRAHPMKRNND